MSGVPLSEVAHVSMGSAPSGQSYNANGDGLPLIAGAGDYGEVHPQPSKWTTSPTVVCRTGDLLVCVRATVGDLNWADREYCLGRGVAGIRPRNGRLHLPYLARFVESRKAHLLTLGKGSTFPAIRRADLDNLEVPLPHPDEQKRVAGILDKADGVRRKRREAIKLADDLLRATFLEMFGDPVTNPKGWDVGVLDDVVDHDDTLNYGVVQPGEEVADGVPLIRAAEVVNGLAATSNFKRIAPTIEAQYERSRIRGNEVLIVCVGSIGAVAEVRPHHVGYNIARAVARVPVSTRVEREFVADYLRTQRVQNYFVNETRTVSQPTLNIKQIKQTPIYLPDRDERQRYVKARQRITSATESLRLAALADEALFNSLMQRAFTGRL